MMPKNQIEIHSEFRLNGNSYCKTDLKALAYDMVKEGKPYEQKIGVFLSDWLDDKLVVEVHTSGSTGTPKSIILQKNHMVNSALATGEYFDLKEGNTVLLCLSAEYIAGKMMLVRALVLGLHLDYVEPTSIPLKEASKEYDFAAMVPLQLERSIARIEKIKKLLVGGAPVSANLKEMVQEKLTKVFETYGMTETITHIAVRNVRLSAVEAQTSYFNAMPNVSFSTDNRGCLLITAPKVSDVMVVTNDVVNLISKTEFEWLGRHDNVINSGGVKLFPEQIEAKLVPFLNRRFFVAGLPDKELGEKLVLIIEGEINSDKILQKLNKAQSIKRFELPKKVFSVPHFAETDTGKIRRAENIRLLSK